MRERGAGERGGSGDVPVQVEFASSEANFLFRACASSPFWSRKLEFALEPEPEPEDDELEAGAAVAAAPSAVTVTVTVAVIVAVALAVAGSLAGASPHCESSPESSSPEPSDDPDAPESSDDPDTPESVEFPLPVPVPLVLFEGPALDPAPEEETWSTSWVPSAMGPAGWAGHEPAGDSGEDMPSGTVPAPPTAVPPTNVVGFAPANWH